MNKFALFTDKSPITQKEKTMKVIIALGMLFSQFAYSGTKLTDIDQAAKMINETLSDVSVCAVKKATDDYPNGYRVVEHTMPDGKKEIVKVVRNTFRNLKKDGDKYVGEFESIRFDKDTGKSRNERLIVKLEPAADGHLQYNLYSPKNPDKPTGVHDLVIEDGNITFKQTSSYMLQIEHGKGNSEKGFKSYPYTIRTAKKDGIVQYGIDDEEYIFSPEIQKKIEAERGRKIFSDKYDENLNQYEAESLTWEEMKAYAEKYGVEAKANPGDQWQTCTPPTAEEILGLEANKKKAASKASLKTMDRSVVEKAATKKAGKGSKKSSTSKQ
jgi:hypothetical protein